MAVIQSGNGNGALQTVDETHEAARFTRRPMDGASFSIAAASGLITGVAADDPLFAMRWGSATKDALIWRVHAKLVVVSGFTAAQEVGAGIYVGRSYTVSPSGGNGLTITGNNAKRLTASATTALTEARISNTGAVTVGTVSLDAQFVAADGAYALAAAATVQNPVIEIEKCFMDDGGPLQLTQNEGLVLRNLVAFGAGGTARLYVEVDWSEVDTGTDW